MLVKSFRFKFLFLILSIGINLIAQKPTLQWANGFGSVINGIDGDFSKGMVKDSSGNVYITGMIQGSVDFDPSPSSTNISSTGTNKDIFVAKYNTNGGLVWVRLVTGFNSEDVVRSITIDKNNNIYIAGIVNFFNPSCLIRKINTNGTTIWTKLIPGEVNAKDIVATKNGILLTGTFLGTADFDPSSAAFNLSTKTNFVNDEALFFAKYDFSGNFIFAKKIYSQGALSTNISMPYLPKFGINGGIPSIASDDDGNIYIADKFADTALFSLPDTSAFLYGGPNFGSKLFIAKYDSLGNFIWVKNITNRLQSYCAIMNTEIKINNNKLYLAGSFFGDSLDFDPSTLAAYLSTPPPLIPNTWNIFMACYDLNGNYKWANALNSKYNNFLGTMKIDNCSNVFISGDFSYSLDFDPSPIQDSIFGGFNTYSNAFIAKYDSLGQYKWAMGVLGKGFNGRPEYLEVHGRLNFEIDQDKIYFTGTFLDTLDFDPSVNTSYLVSKNNSRDFFIAKYNMMDTICNSTALKDDYIKNSSNGTSHIFPNPFDKNLKLKSPVNIIKVELTNAIGQIISTSNIPNKTEVELNLETLKKGIYYIKISTESSSTVQKIIKN